MRNFSIVKPICILLMLLGYAALASGQVARQGTVLSGSGRPVAGASIWVCTGNVTVTLTANPPCTPAQNIYTDYAQTHLVTQPLLTDGLGNYLYYTQSGTVTEAVTGSGIVGYSAVLTLAAGNGAVKPAASDGIQYVSNNGNDSNDGLSLGSAKLTTAAACAALPSGNTGCSAGNGTVWISPGFTGTIIVPSVTTVQVIHLTGASVGNLPQLDRTNTWTSTQQFNSTTVFNNTASFTGQLIPVQINYSETVAPSGQANSDTVYGDNTLHELLSNYNNGGFFRIPQVIASGTSTMTSGAITAATCQTAITSTATGTATTDAIEWSYATAPTLTTDALLHVSPYVTSGNVNFTRCNPTAGSITGTAIVINWRVIR